MLSGTHEERHSLERAGCGIASVAICVATYRRAEGLRRLLQALEKLKFETSPAPSVRIIVVDNDPSSSIGFQAHENVPNFPWELSVLAEERAGISFARNTAVEEALALGADAVAFLDDDEVPEPGWLEALLRVQASSGAEIVSGPVLPLFEDPIPAWVIQGKFFERPRFPTGTSIEFARTGNLLIHATVLKKLNHLFDERFGLSGGEDTLLISQLRRRGARIVWADEAIVWECIPRSRASARYILRRAFAAGSSWSRVERVLDPGSLVALKRGVAGLTRIAQGALFLLPSLFVGRHTAVRNAMKTSLGMGMLSGLLGFGSELYGSSGAKSREDVTSKVLIVQSQMKQYRSPFFDKLHDTLARDGVALRVAYSDPSPSEAKKRDNEELPAEYGVKVRGFRILGGKIFYQPLFLEILAADMVVVEQANKHVLNYCLFVLSALGIKKVAFWGHGRIRQREKSRFSEWLRNRTLNCVDWWFGYTEGSVRYLVQRGVPASKITNVQNTIDATTFRHLCADISSSEVLAVRRQLKISETAKVGLFCGGIFHDKLPELLIESARQIRQCVPNFELLIVGGGPMQAVAEAAGREETWIRYLGPKFGREKALLFRLADALLIPGVVGLAILDAFSAGLPLVTSAVALHGPEIEYLEEGRNGMMTAVDPKAYSDTVIKLLSDARLLQDLKNGALASSEKYSVECMVERFHSGIVRCLTGRATASALSGERIDRSHHVKTDEL